ncbi:MAG: DUF488 family protein, N3 subclade [Burkholderiales bacterium]
MVTRELQNEAAPARGWTSSGARKELAVREPIWQELVKRARKGRVTLLYAAKDAERNNAVVLKSFLADK